MAILAASQKVEYRKMRFAASLKGVDLDAAADKQEKTFADIVREREIEEGLATEPLPVKDDMADFGIAVEESN